jgi:LysM repeat protein
MQMKWKRFFRMGLTAAFLTAGLSGTPLSGIAAGSQSDAPNVSGSGAPGEIVETESGIYYTVKKGDTLWDLSRKFADSPYLWPDLWSGNDQISNPHRIYPGQRIQLYRRDNIARGTQPTSATAQPPRSESPALDEFTYSRIDRVGFIRDPAVSPTGRIFKVLGIHKMITAGDTVYIARENNQELSPGQRFTVYRTIGEVHHTETDAYIGIQHYILGTVEITQTEPDYVMGRVVKAFGRIQKDDLLMPYERRAEKIVKVIPPPGITGEVIMAEEHNQLLGDNVIAFINRGTEDGVKPGQVYDIYNQEEAYIGPQSTEKKRLKPVLYGKLLVLRTEATTSTVYITEARQVILPGTQFSSPSL